MVKKVSEILIFRKPVVSDQCVVNKKVEELEEKVISNTPGPHTVGTEEIIDGSVMMEDLSDEVKQNMTATSVDEEEENVIIGGQGQ